MSDIPPLGRCLSSGRASEDALKYATRQAEQLARKLGGGKPSALSNESRMTQLEEAFVTLFSIMGVAGLFAIMQHNEKRKKPRKPRKKRRKRHD